MKRRWIMAAVAALLGSFCLAQTPSTWKLATGYRAESFHTLNIMQFSRDVEQATAGQLLIQVHANNTLAKLNDISQAVQQGKAEAGETIMSSLAKDIAIAGADSVPFVVNSYKDAQRLWKLQRPGIEKHFTERGLKLLYAVPWPPQGLHSSKPVRGLADFKGTQMRTYNQTTLRIAEMLGAKPVDVAMVDVGQALTEGRMDNMITSALTGLKTRSGARSGTTTRSMHGFPKTWCLSAARPLRPSGPRCAAPSSRLQLMQKSAAGWPARRWP